MARSAPARKRGRRGFSIIAHTADTGIQAYGDDLRELFVNAARGLAHVITDLERIAERESREVAVTARDEEALLVAWLNELIYLFDAEGLLFHRFDVVDLTSTSIQATAYGERVDPARHAIKTGVKAATFHALRITQGSNGYTARVILDV